MKRNPHIPTYVAVDETWFDSEQAVEHDAVDEWLLHGPFVNRARVCPQATAAICGDQSITYGELLENATRLARHLRALGVENGALVGLSAERSIDMVVGVFGILLSGGAYVPFDPTYPAERLEFMLDDARVKVLLTQRNLAPQFTAGRTTFVLLDEPWPIESADNEELPEIDANQLAYVIYTSGSTGRPKGVMITHRAAMNTIHDINRRFEVSPEDRVLALSSLCFDLSVYDIFGLLAVGGALVIPTAAGLREPAFWAEQVVRHQVTLWNSVPAFMEMLVTHAGGMNHTRLDSLRVVMLSGDWIAVSLPDRIRTVARQAEVISLGGATEGSIWSIYFCIDRVDPAWKSIPYGRALDNQSVVVLDEEMRTCGVGVIGEIYIGGIGVAAGYLNREELTAQRFVPDPAAMTEGGRLYRTGDLGRLLADGNIEFLGRMDHQVKVSGYRIELGEVETMLARQPQVAEAVVTALPSPSGGKYLAAHLTTRDQAPLDQKALLAGLRQSLPEYMIPTRIVWLEKMPLNANGKIDRGALLESRNVEAPSCDRPTRLRPSHSAVARQEGYSSKPGDQIERRLTAIWEQTFDMPSIGVRDNFFELGGDSLLTTALLARMEREFQQTFSIGVLLERPTVEQLAEWLRSDQRIREFSSLVLLQAGDSRQPPLFCVPGIHGSLWEFRKLATLLDANLPVYGLEPRGLDGRRLPDRRIADMACHYVEEVQRVQPVGPYYLAGYSLGGPVAYEMAQLLRATGEHVALLAMIDAPVGGHSPHMRSLQHFANRVVACCQWVWRATTQAAGYRPRIEDDRRDDLKTLDEMEEFTPGRALVVETHLRALDEYSPRPYGDRIVLFRAMIPPPWPKRWFADTSLQWLKWAQGEVHLVPGSHDDLFKGSNIEQLAEKLVDAMRTAR